MDVFLWLTSFRWKIGLFVPSLSITGILELSPERPLLYGRLALTDSQLWERALPDSLNQPLRVISVIYIINHVA